MPNDKLTRLLDLSRKVNNIQADAQNHPAPIVNEGRVNPFAPQAQNNMPLYQPAQQQREPYTAEKEMEEIKQGRRPAVDITTSNLPKNIFESIVNNPLDLDPAIVSSGSQMTEFMNNLAEKSQGLKKMQETMKKLDGADQQRQQTRIDEQLKQRSSSGAVGGGVDYSLIKTIVEGVVNDKLKSFKEELGTLQQASNNVIIMTFKDGFLYVTEDGKVYECTMKFKGYNKNSRKQ